MTNYYELVLKLTDKQKINLAKSIKNKCPFTIRIKLSNIDPNESDKLLITERQKNKILKALDNGKGTDIKMSRTQISLD